MKRISQHAYHINHTQMGETALMTATRYGRITNVVELIRSGANMNLQDKVYTY